ncbi:MAG: dTDP-4-dehydrorhamnose reductase [Proteobacteria bacterium]|nr:dTDP-4-dehydrorhamnose reductase [Pseudomonadota bacterium]
MADRDADVVLLGADGMLGRAFRERMAAAGLRVRAPAQSALDLTRLGSIEQGLGEPRVVVNCAAHSDVDAAEEHGPLATAVNGTGVGWLAQVCAARGALLVHFSTDYVFDGLATSPYTVDHQVMPINAYGRSKARGEELLRQSGCRYLLIRTSWLYAPWGRNFVRTISSLAQQRNVLRVVDDQRGRPSSALGLTRITLALLDTEALGAYHVCDGGMCSWYEFAREIVAQRKLACRVEPCSSPEFPRPARRPAWSVLDLSQTESRIGPMTHWKKALAEVLGRL